MEMLKENNSSRVNDSESDIAITLTIQDGDKQGTRTILSARHISVPPSPLLYALSHNE
jgi:hypothetical protein